MSDAQTSATTESADRSPLGRRLMVIILSLVLGAIIAAGTQQTANAIAAYTKTPTLTATPTAIPAGADNKVWTPVERDFAGVPMVQVPAGCFKMGSEQAEIAALNKEYKTNAFDDEGPTHEVCIDKPYWIDKYEVSNGQFAQFKGQAGGISNWTDDNLPRDSITWIEATAFCQLRGAVLPTEAQWEYAARGPQGLVYPWGDDFNADNVVYRGNSGNKTASVGSKWGGVSWVGAYDLSGNVWEWTSSLYKPYPYDATDGREDQSNRSDLRVLRGGSWYLNIDVRGADRNGFAPGSVLGNWGVRCVRSFE